VPDPFKVPGTNVGFSPAGISVPISNPFNPFTVPDTTLDVNGVPTPVTTDVRFRGINDTGKRSEKFTYRDSLFDVGLRGHTGEFELTLGYITINGDLFNLPAGPVSFAIGAEYCGERMTRNRDPLNQTFNSIGSVDGQGFRVNRDVWSIYQEVRVPFTSPTW